jgi:hypothetical protein
MRHARLRERVRVNVYYEQLAEPSDYDMSWHTFSCLSQPPLFYPEFDPSY